MKMPHFPTPKCGDIFFTRQTKGVESITSVLVQLLVDEKARKSSKQFTHAAIAADSKHVLEAVPEPDEEEMRKARKDPTKGVWSDVDLSFGVRVRPIPDLIIEAWKSGSDLVGLRKPSVSSDNCKQLDLGSDEILLRIGNPYSIDDIRYSLETYVKKLTNIDLRPWTEAYAESWSSRATDLEALMGLTDEFRREMERVAPNCLTEYRSRKYFCSQLVSDLLCRADMLEAKHTTRDITPTGLYGILINLGWVDVTESDYGTDMIEALSNNESKRLACSADYISWKALHSTEIPIRGSGFFLEAMAGALERDKGKLDDRWKRFHFD
jgi:hypothetical protein